MARPACVVFKTGGSGPPLIPSPGQDDDQIQTERKSL
jgi:hypothetical protein